MATLKLEQKIMTAKASLLLPSIDDKEKEMRLEFHNDRPELGKYVRIHIFNNTVFASTFKWTYELNVYTGEMKPKLLQFNEATDKWEDIVHSGWEPKSAIYLSLEDR
jgi:hypothetical protein